MRLTGHRSSLLLALLCSVVLLAGCGKSAPSASSGASATGGPLSRQLAPVARQGAVSVTTRNTTRLGGADPTADAAAVARAVYPALTPATRPATVVLADERNWPVALAATSLASAPLGAPLLLTEGNSLPEVSANTLEALGPLGAPALGGAQVLLVGNAAPLPKSYLAQTVASGQAAPEAAASIEQVLRRLSGRAPRQVIVLAAESTPALAMPAAGLAAESGAPILYVTQAQVPAATASVLKGLGHPAIYVIDPAQVGATTLAALRKLGTVTEIAGGGEASSAAANAVDVARFADTQFGWGVKEPGHGLVFANATRPLDAVAAAPLSATGDYGPLLLLESATQIPPPLATYLADIQPAYTPAFNFRPVRGVYNHGWLIGDESAIAAVTQAELDTLLEISPRKQSSEPSVTPVE